jgi:hypothetical protein
VEIGDDEKPVPQGGHEVGPLCKLAAMWSGREDFQKWLEHKFPSTWLAAQQVLGEETFGPINDTDVASEVIRMLCEVKTRKDLDTSETARKHFDSLIRLPFGQWVHAQRP